MTTEEIDKAAEEYANKRFSSKDIEMYQLSGKQVSRIIKTTFASGVEFSDKHWQEKTRWIPVEERLPVKPSRTRQILGKDKHTVWVVFISCSDEGYLNSLESLKREFTHWKEIDLAF